MEQITEQDKEIGQHLAKMVTAQNTPNYRRVLADNEKYIAAEIAKVRKDARVSSDADKARIADERRHFESALEDVGPFLENLRCAVTVHASRTDLTERIDHALKAVHTALEKGDAR